MECDEGGGKNARAKSKHCPSEGFGNCSHLSRLQVWGACFKQIVHSLSGHCYEILEVEVSDFSVLYLGRFALGVGTSMCWSNSLDLVLFLRRYGW